MFPKLLVIINLLLSVFGGTEITRDNRKVDALNQAAVYAYSYEESNLLVFSANEEYFEKSGDRVENISMFPEARELGSKCSSLLNVQTAVNSRKQQSFNSCIKTVQSGAINKSPLIKSLRI